MISSKTTFIVGAGAGCELELPSGPDLTTRIAQSFDFERFVGELQTRDSTIVQQYLHRLAAPLKTNPEAMRAAADRIRNAAKLIESIDAILDQQSHDPLAAAAGKIAVAHFICQAEAKSTLRPEARLPGDLPIQGTENWLFEFVRLITAGVPRAQAERCLDQVGIVNFNYDRSIEHLLPHALVMAFGMAIEEAQAIVDARLTMLRPFGSIGRLPWQRGEVPACEWGTEMPANINHLAGQIRTLSELRQDRQTLAGIQQVLAGAERIAILGFGFDPRNVDLLFSAPFEQKPEIVATFYDMTAARREAALRTLERRTGVTRADGLIATDTRSYEAIRDYSLLLES